MLPVAEADAQHGIPRWDFDKAFHVSPFMPMQPEYRWRFCIPGDALRVHMDMPNDGEREFYATLALE